MITEKLEKMKQKKSRNAVRVSVKSVRRELNLSRRITLSILSVFCHTTGSRQLNNQSPLPSRGPFVMTVWRIQVVQAHDGLTAVLLALIKICI